MKAALIAIAILCACSKKEEAKQRPLPPLPAAEIQRARDACNAYVERACACAAPAGQKQCPLAKPLPEALKIALDVTMNPETAPEDMARAQVNVRETVKECIEQTAKLPALGCP